MGKHMWTVPGIVRRVVDGDTLIVDLDQGWRTWRLGEYVRLRGINAPERDTPEGVDAVSFIHGVFAWGAVLSVPVTVISTALDKYGRIEGIVKLQNGQILNDLLVEHGYAERVKV